MKHSNSSKNLAEGDLCGFSAKAVDTPPFRECLEDFQLHGVLFERLASAVRSWNGIAGVVPEWNREDWGASLESTLKKASVHIPASVANCACRLIREGKTDLARSVEYADVDAIAHVLLGTRPSATVMVPVAFVSKENPVTGSSDPADPDCGTDSQPAKRLDVIAPKEEEGAGNGVIALLVVRLYPGTGKLFFDPAQACSPSAPGVFGDFQAKMDEAWRLAKASLTSEVAKIFSSTWGILALSDADDWLNREVMKWSLGTMPLSGGSLGGAAARAFGIAIRSALASDSGSRREVFDPRVLVIGTVKNGLLDATGSENDVRGKVLALGREEYAKHARIDRIVVFSGAEQRAAQDALDQLLKEGSIEKGSVDVFLCPDDRDESVEAI
jgi:hypothetical protein